MTITLPDPDTHCFDEDKTPPADVWSYSPDLVRQIIEADRAQRGEPVAWMVVNESGTDAFVTADPTLAQADQRALPLYTAPQPDRKPMPDNEMNDLAFQCGIQREDARDPGVEEFARAIEAFHGIKP